MTLSITGFVWAQQQVTVVVDGESRSIETQASSVGGALAEAGVDLDEDDVVSPAVNTPLTRGMTITVRHSVPVTLVLGGERVEADVVGETVADALVANGIDPSVNPAVEPDLDAALEPGMTIAVPDVFVRVVREEVEIPAGTKRVKDESMPSGATRVVSEGKPGRIMRLYRVAVAAGVETSPILTAEHVLTEPTPRVVAFGTDEPETSIAVESSTIRIPAPPSAGTRMRVLATGYSAQQPDLGLTTATGARARRGVIAVDPDVIPLGTRVYVPGYGYAIAADTGGAVTGKHIDLCFDTVAEAIAWGRQTVTIIILK